MATATRRIPVWAPWLLLALSVAAHVLVTLAGADPFKMIDLRVYLDGAGWALDGTLYDSTSDSTSAAGTPIELPFTYPPFAALVFVPLAQLNYGVARVLWQLASLAAVTGIVYLALRLLGRAGPHATRPLPQLSAVLATGTALALWLEPVRTTFNYGQINLFLAILLLAGAAVLGPRAAASWRTPAAGPAGTASLPWWRSAVAGLTVGIAAGIKLVPAITGFYYLAQRRWHAVLWSGLGFLVTVGFGAVFLPSETSRYFLRLIFDPARTGPVFGAINQSWRGALARLAGQPDVPGVWAVAVLLTLVLGIAAVRGAVRRQDALAAFLVVQFVGLLVSPISWSHHWVWVLPLLIWGFFGPRSAERQVRVLMAGWLLACFSYLVSVLVAQPDNYEIPARPLWAALAGTVYVVLGIASMVVLGRESRSAGSGRLSSSATRESGAPG